MSGELCLSMRVNPKTRSSPTRPGIQSTQQQTMAFYVYILASRQRGTLYAGVTNDLARRVHEHREKDGSTFTRRYGVTRLVYYEPHDSPDAAIAREKRLKRWPRAWKVQAIEKHIPDWLDLYEDLNR